MIPQISQNIETLLAILITISFSGIAGTIHFALKYFEAKKTIKGDKVWKDTSYDQIKELRKSFTDSVAEIKRLVTQEKTQNEKIVAFSVMISELTDENKLKSDELRICYERIETMSGGLKVLVDKNRLLESCNADNLERINKLESKISHSKYVPLNQQKTGSIYWECIDSELARFIKGEKYKQSDRKTHANLIWIENDTHTYLVHKSSFKAI